MPYQNPNCDGSGPCSRGQVRVLPLSDESNLILCERCFQHEIAWRRGHNRSLIPSAQFDLPKWADLTVYSDEVL